MTEPDSGDDAAARVAVYLEGGRIVLERTATGARVELTRRQALAVIGFLLRLRDQLSGDD